MASHMTTRQRVLVLTFVLVLLFLAGLTAIGIADERELRFIAANEEQNIGRIAGTVILMLGKPLELVAKDYSLWDDMVRFIRTHDPGWASLYLDESLPLFGVDAVLVTSANGDIIYGKGWADQSIPNGSSHPDITGWIPKSDTPEDWFTHFYITIGNSVMEIRGAPVQPSADEKRLTAPRGFLFYGKLWSTDRVSEIASLTDCIATVSVQGKPDNPVMKNVPRRDRLKLPIQLKDFSGSAIATLTLEKDMVIYRKSRMQNGIRSILFGLLALAIILLQYVLLTVWMDRPLALISRALTEENPSMLERLGGQKTEIGKIARLVVHFFSQQKRLVGEIKERATLESKLHYLAYHDPLTGLSNRLLFAEYLEHEIQRAMRYKQIVALFFIDLDRFKQINDTLGHDTGDEVLRITAERIKSCTRESDIVCRVGGDEFTVILTDLSEPGAIIQVVERILDQFVGTMDLSGHSVHITPSIGICLCPEDGGDVSTLMKHADIAMYQAKTKGRNTYHFFTRSLSEDTEARTEIEQRLHGAIGGGELTVFFQPQIATKTGTLCGLEALVRWNHPERGLLQPGEFLDVAEESGLIVPMGAFVLRETCRRITEWSKEGSLPFKVAVNISPHQIRDGQFLDTVSAILSETGCPPDMLEFEITESAALSDFDAVSIFLGRLHEMGIQTAVDDFGTGYSSFVYLTKLKITTLKIGQVFIADLEGGGGEKSIVSAIIQLGHMLGIERIIAEGVETEHQLELLRMMGCDIIQGYYFSKPIPGDEVENYIRDRTKKA